MTIDFNTLRAQDMSMEAVVSSFVVPETFDQLTTNDNAFLIGPRGSGKTTLLKMLSCRYIQHWNRLDQASARRHTGSLDFTGVFLPTDSLWTTQTHPSAGAFAFGCQLLNRLVDAMQFRAQTAEAPDDREDRVGARLSPRQEVELVAELSEVWQVPVGAHTLRSLLASLDRILLTARSEAVGTPISREPFLMATHGARIFNRLVGEQEHRWGILIDELEIAPDEIVSQVMRLARGGSGELLLKVSMSPSDHMRSGVFDSVIGRPMPGHDFVPVHLLSQSMAAKRQFTQVLWEQTLRGAGIEPVSVETSFGRSFQASARDEGIVEPVREEFELALSWDKTLADWLEGRGLTVDKLDLLGYEQRSAMVRKIYPLLVYRNGIYKRSNDPVGWGRRSRKKEFEAFAGAAQIINALEGNPRWIKSAFRLMVERASPVNGHVDAPMQYSALLDVAQSFESFLRFLPAPVAPGRVVNDISLMQFIDAIAKSMSGFHAGPFNADPPNSFMVDERSAEWLGPLIDLGLHSGGIVHLRSGASSPILSDYVGQRFRLTYLLAVRPQLSFPMRLGRPVKLSRILTERGLVKLAESRQSQLELVWGDHD